jgi:NAD(P)-dependent dehydrogenase (short-subunit alcohol dehydrogenase family)
MVTGAGLGIGRATAERFADLGDRVAAVDIDAAAAERAVASMRSRGGTAAAFVADVADAGGRSRLVDEVSAQLGPVDVLVNNAAQVGQRIPFLAIDHASWLQLVEVNLTASAFLTQLVAPSMIERGEGCIVNVSGIQASLPLPTYAAYAATKGGLVALTRALAVELSPVGIRVNAVEPGSIATPGAAEAASIAARESDEPEPSSSPTLLGRLGRADEVATAITFLASSDASFITGAVLRVDGGRILSRAPDVMSSLKAVVERNVGRPSQ